MAAFVLEHLWIFGAVIVAIALLQGLVAITGMLRRHSHAEAQRRLHLELLHHQIEAAKQHRYKEEQSALCWNGVRKFQVQKKGDEGGSICSFYLVPHDRKAIPAFKPGQYLTFIIQIAGQSKPTIRCYSLSDAPNETSYRVSIKRLPPPPNRPELPAGLVSNYFHDHVREGDILDVKAPGGQFFLDMSSSRPVVLIGGGIGITPVLSMLNAIVQAGSTREVWFFYGVRNRREHIMREHLERIDRAHENIRLCVCYSNPGEEDVQGREYQFNEYVSVDLFKRVLPSNNLDFYICGPPAMMASLVIGLEDWGVPESRVHFEAFGPATVKKTHQARKSAEPAESETAAFEVSFARSNKTISWNADYESVLDFAEANDIAIESGCRAGNCGTCMTAIKSGAVQYSTEPGFDIEEGSCLTCICVPKGPLVLDA